MALRNSPDKLSPAIKKYLSSAKASFPRKHTEDFQTENDVMLWDCNPSRDILGKEGKRDILIYCIF